MNKKGFTYTKSSWSENIKYYLIFCSKYITYGRSTQYIVGVVALLVLLLIIFHLPSFTENSIYDVRREKIFPEDVKPVLVPKPKSHYQWEKMSGLTNQSDVMMLASDPMYRGLLAPRLRNKPLASNILGGQPVYISLTTIHSRIYGIAATIESVIDGVYLPDHIYIFVSKAPYLLDEGITVEQILTKAAHLKQIVADYPFLSIIFTENIGPHRKLLPLLSQKWKEDCVIVTVDDHEIYPRSTLSSLVDYYNITGRDSVVAIRSRRMGICSDAPPWHISPYNSNTGRGIWPEAAPVRREMLTLPTGTGGVLYRPQFFHPIIFDRHFLNLTRTADDLMFRLATMAKGVTVVTACMPERHRCSPIESVIGAATLKTIVPPSIRRPENNPYLYLQPTRSLPQLGLGEREVLMSEEDVSDPRLTNFNAISTDDRHEESATDASDREEAVRLPDEVLAHQAQVIKEQRQRELDLSIHRPRYHLNQEVFRFSRNYTLAEREAEKEAQSSTEILNTMMLMVNRNRRHRYLTSENDSEIESRNDTENSVEIESTSFPDTSIWSSFFTIEDSQYTVEVNGRLRESLHEHNQQSQSQLHSQLHSQSNLRQRFVFKESEENDIEYTQSDQHSQPSKDQHVQVPMSTHNYDNYLGSYSRRLSWFSAPKKVDPRKQISLASMYNGNGTIGNNAIWDSAVRYLMQKTVLDIVLLVQQYAPQERKQCLYSESVLQERSTESREYISGIFFDLLHSMRLSYQSFYDKECGINFCQSILR